MTARVRVRVPATSANLGPGYDSFGLALGLYDEVLAETADDVDAGSADVAVEGEGAGSVPTDASNLVVRAMHETWAELGRPAPGVRLRCRNAVPHGRGLGSSAAALVTGVTAARALLGLDLDRAAVLATAARLEGHPDNVAAAALGGLTVAWSDGTQVDAVRVEVTAEVRPVLLVPATTLATETARSMLPASVPHADAARNAARAALLVVALSRRPDLLLPATEDRLHQAQRAPAMPATAALVAGLRAAGHAAVVSGAGPSVLVLGDASTGELPVPEGWWRHDLPVDVAGVQVVPES
jgi:homoserine kinase